MALFVPKRLSSAIASRFGIFEVHRHEVTSPRGGSWGIYTLEIADWVSTAAVTEEGKFVLVRQHRYGIDAVTLEVAGGLVDHEEDPQQAAVRELREETGYEGARVTPLGWVHPNPAMQRNRCHLFLVTGASEAGPLEPDTHESTEPVVMSRAEVQKALADGRISHAMTVLTLERAMRLLNDGA